VSNRRLLVGYAVVAAILAVCAVISIVVGHDRDPAPAIAGVYDSNSPCLGERFELEQSGRFVNLGGSAAGSGKLEIEDSRLQGDAACLDGQAGDVDLAIEGSGEDVNLVGTAAGEPVEARYAEPLPEPGVSGPPKKRSAEETVGRLMLAIAVVILVARLFGIAMNKIGQPRVMGEVIAGILLGPTLLGAVAPEVKDYLFPADIVPLISAVAQVGLVFYLFLVGMELEPTVLRRDLKRAAIVSNTSVAFPLALGLLLAVPLYTTLAPDKGYVPFALFIGVSMSITAFPVLARILIERRMLKKPVGSLALSSAAVDDVTAWGLLAFATAIAGSGSGWDAVWVIALAAVFTAAMVYVARPLLGRVGIAYDEVGFVPQFWLGLIFVGVLLSAYVSQQIGIAPIFGAFIVGLIMPRRAGLTDDVSHRLQDFVVAVLLPLFFVVTGLRTEVGDLDRVEYWLLGLLILVVAVVGKWVGAMAAARFSGMTLRESTAVGVLMNTRGLTELIVLNIGLDLGLISPALFTILVLMALITTFMAGPILRLVDRKGELSEPPEEELRRALRAQPAAAPSVRGSILVAPQDEKRFDALIGIAELLARSEPPRELILTRLVEPARLPTALAAADRELSRVTRVLTERRDELVERGLNVRTLTFTTPSVGEDLVRLASEQEVDLMLITGRRPLVGEAVPGGDMGVVLRKASCDVAALLERGADPPTLDESHPVIVPFGGAEHDWAALELGAWLAYAGSAPLKLLGAAADDGDRDASRLLANASLIVQQLSSVTAEPLLVRPGRDLVGAAIGAGILVIGLSERWEEEGIGPVRGEIATRTRVPTLFVRRGTRPGALAPRDTMTRFRWSAATARELT
jgi:K+:H+ antiporter